MKRAGRGTVGHPTAEAEPHNTRDLHNTKHAYSTVKRLDLTRVACTHSHSLSLVSGLSRIGTWQGCNFDVQTTPRTTDTKAQRRADFFTKPLPAGQFHTLRKRIMNEQ